MSHVRARGTCLTPTQRRRPPGARSDYYDSGRWAVSHAADKLLASAFTLYTVGLTLYFMGAWPCVLLVTPALSVKAMGSHYRKREERVRYEVAHSLWHLLGGIACMIAACSSHGASGSIFATPECARQTFRDNAVGVCCVTTGTLSALLLFHARYGATDAGDGARPTATRRRSRQA